MRAYLKQPWAIIAVLAWLSGLMVFSLVIDQSYWNMRFIVGKHKADPSIVVVAVDTTRQPDRPAWSQADDARLLNVISREGPKAVFYDPRSDDGIGPELQKAFRELHGRLSVVARQIHTPVRTPSLQVPAQAPESAAPVVASIWRTNAFGYAESAPYSYSQSGKTYPALPAVIAGATASSGDFTAAFDINWKTVKTIPAADLLKAAPGPDILSGKTVIVSHMREGDDGTVGFYANGRVDPTYVDIAAANGLRRGHMGTLRGYWLLGVFLIAFLGTCRIRRRPMRMVAYAIIFPSLLVAPAIVQIFFGMRMYVSESFVAAVVCVGMRAWYLWRRKVRETSTSGLPNFIALVQEKELGRSDMIVAVIARYEEFLATIPPELHSECARQVARRFAVGCGARPIYHGQAGFFAWTEPTRAVEDQLEHLDGMRSLFAAPLLVGGHMFDTNVHFGLDRNYQIDGESRVNTALASASEALRAGRPVELFQADRLANAAWELSLLARIDEGMRNGDIWLAYQPQWDYREARISGAEALIRWNDPVRGPIRPDEFIVQAERAGRIDALTYWVLEQAIDAAEELNAITPRFQTSINLSAMLVDKPGLISSVREIVKRRGIDCRWLTVEVTETARLRDRSAAIANLRDLRAMGFRLSIDDFGTGEASLLYLAELPSDELKIDRAFVSRIVHHDRERHIVRSTIKLAHALGQTVVAEGIEDIATFDLLRKLGCDAGQGYYVGRPETLAHLRNRCLGDAKELRARP